MNPPLEPSSQDARSAPAVARNRDPILAVLRRVLPERGTVLEIASGTGEHAVHFAAALPQLVWQPTDRDASAFRSIAAHRHFAGLPNLRPPLQLDVMAPEWPVAHADAIVSINMIHIAPWTAAEALMIGAARVLASNGVLFLYGPFFESDVEAAPSNLGFDADLRRRDIEWGVRKLDDVRRLAATHGMDLVERVAMPANNLSLVFQKAAMLSRTGA